ncbi:MAG: hydroxymethylpyrimidine/phosphomethylpyrimidine kinase [Candidatus Cloacimonadia bacterium]
MSDSKPFGVRKTEDYFLSIAATDPTGEAGVYKDIKVASYLDYNTIGVVTALTVQNDERVFANYPIDSHILRQQLDIAITFPLKRVKIGALGSVENALIISDYLPYLKDAYTVWDPVFSPTEGVDFINKSDVRKIVENILPSIDIITPNYGELQLILDQENSTFEETIKAAQEITKQYGLTIYLTGGHLLNKSGTFNEYYIAPNEMVTIHRKRAQFPYGHGTGCTFSSALACLSAASEVERCQLASDFVLKAYGI